MSWYRRGALVPAVVLSLLLLEVVLTTVADEVDPHASNTASGIALAVWLGYLVAGLLLQASRWESRAIKMLANARELSVAEQSVVAPALELMRRQELELPRLYVRYGRPTQGPSSFGPGTVLLPPKFLESRGLGHGDDLGVAIAIAHAQAKSHALAARWDIAVSWWLLPGTTLRALISKAAHALRGHKLLGLLLMFGWAYAVVAIVITFAQGVPGVGVVVALIASVAYGSPWAYRRWQKEADLAADQAVARVGWGESWAHMLAAWRDPGAFDRGFRIRNIEPTQPLVDDRHLQLVATR